MDARPAAERYCELSLESVEAEARRLVADAVASGSWRSLVEPLRALRDRAEMLEAHIAAVTEAIG